MQFKRIVAHGYDLIADRLARERGHGTTVTRWLADLSVGLPDGARVLDLGCGSGVPHTAFLAKRFDVLGVDISRCQIELAANSVPAAQFILADMCSVGFPPGSFDAVTAIYSVIHVPRNEQPRLLHSIRRWLKPSGHAFLVLGGCDTPVGFEADWFGTPMLWSHYDATTSLKMLQDADFDILSSALEVDPLDPKGSHLFALCRAA
ncbi:MAG: class I SAM-dependent methyltransferase [Chloroflexi bacterium]|nr:class I SAM-dependent methyltransferase [Chloroflexota bacterium]